VDWRRRKKGERQTRERLEIKKRERKKERKNPGRHQRACDWPQKYNRNADPSAYFLYQG
jgi:hypothetical protein